MICRKRKEEEERDGTNERTNGSVNVERKIERKFLGEKTVER
jgi:hypothetical protein